VSISNCLVNRHFLVVDDEEFVRTLVSRFLKRSGAAGVIEASDGIEAIAAIGSYDMLFDVIVSDINMRPMNGLELLSAIRTGAGGLKRNTPVLMLTAHAEADFVADALALDADAFVVKPIARETLIDRVVRVLERTVPIGPAARYAAVGKGPKGEGVSPAPALLSGVVPSGDMIATAQHVALENVKVNSILAQDIRFGEAENLLLASPVILTQALLERLNDLQQLHNTYSHLWVVEPRLLDEDRRSGDEGTSALAALHGVAGRTMSEQMVGGLYLAPALVDPDTAGAALVEQIRSQTDDVAERAQARVDRENRASESV
jgi:CheY-like chemotaxis protein